MRRPTSACAIREIYTGVMAAPTPALKRWLAALRNDNAAGEYYLTDVVASAVGEGVEVVGVGVGANGETEVLGVNSAAQLADLERRYQRAAAARLMAAGVRLADPGRFDQRGELRCGSDVEIDIGCVFEGTVELGDGVRVGAYCMLRNARVDAGATIRPYTHIDGESLGARVGPGALVGPFASACAPAPCSAPTFTSATSSRSRTRPSATAPRRIHLAYLGDTDVGARVNYGAGSITANYDGANKHRTTTGRRRLHWQQLRPGRAGRDRRGRDDRRRLDDQQGRAGRRASTIARARQDNAARLEAARQALTSLRRARAN